MLTRQNLECVGPAAIAMIVGNLILHGRHCDCESGLIERGASRIEIYAAATIAGKDTTVNHHGWGMIMIIAIAYAMIIIIPHTGHVSFDKESELVVIDTWDSDLTSIQMHE